MKVGDTFRVKGGVTPMEVVAVGDDQACLAHCGRLFVHKYEDLVCCDSAPNMPVDWKASYEAEHAEVQRLLQECNHHASVARRLQDEVEKGKRELARHVPENEILAKRNAKLTSDNEGLVRENFALKNKVSNWAEVMDLRNSLDASIRMRKSTEERANKAEDERDALKKKLDEMTSLCGTYDASYRLMDAELSQATQKLTLAEKMNAALAKEVAELRSRPSQTSRTLRGYRLVSVDGAESPLFKTPADANRWFEQGGPAKMGLSSYWHLARVSRRVK